MMATTEDLRLAWLRAAVAMADWVCLASSAILRELASMLSLRDA
jgi:hypothetical protein